MKKYYAEVTMGWFCCSIGASTEIGEIVAEALDTAFQYGGLTVGDRLEVKTDDDDAGEKVILRMVVTA